MITLVILVVVFLAVVITAIVALLRLGIAREESDYSLYSEPPTVAAAMTRRLLGWHGPVPSHAAQPDYAANLASASQRPRRPAIALGPNAGDLPTEDHARPARTTGPALSRAGRHDVGSRRISTAPVGGQAG